MRVLIADDEPRIRKLVSDFLKKENIFVIEAENGRQAMDIFATDDDFDLIILDVMMPEYDGWTVCREIRKASQVPIFMLTARGDENDELFGFEMGVDDYITKPFSPRTLVARVKSLEKRINQHTEETEIETLGDLEVNRKGHFVSLKGERLDLSPKEYELLLLLIENKESALSRQQILNAVWDFDYHKGMRTVDTHIKRLRHKLGDWGSSIQTVRNIGYRFEVGS